jgi:homospermidine synthase
MYWRQCVDVFNVWRKAILEIVITSLEASVCTYRQVSTEKFITFRSTTVYDYMPVKDLYDFIDELFHSTLLKESLKCIFE